MFGEYALYQDGRVVAPVCDDELFVKPAAAGRAVPGEVEEAASYPARRGIPGGRRRGGRRAAVLPAARGGAGAAGADAPGRG
ncbi:hypothetical protein [Fulvimonas yonginensis]|uniref:Uncharacterized protein n=1 Tax=Fulvimonas yonginensis TaxID=1495200 RepID=A0ABU8JF89_9GAMM